jgi:maltose O-acetyltransferase
MVAPTRAATVLWLANLVSAITPQTRLFGLRRALFVSAGVTVARQARICGTARIHHPNVSIGASWIGARVDVISTGSAPVRIGDRCDIGPGVALVTGTHVIGDHARRAGAGKAAAIEVGDGSWIGARATFLAGAGVGAGCIVAAGAVVTQQFGDDVLVAGVPAKVVRELP